MQSTLQIQVNNEHLLVIKILTTKTAISCFHHRLNATGIEMQASMFFVRRIEIGAINTKA